MSVIVGPPWGSGSGSGCGSAWGVTGALAWMAWVALASVGRGSGGPGVSGGFRRSHVVTVDPH
jgi:hypothetical protein